MVCKIVYKNKKSTVVKEPHIWAVRKWQFNYICLKSHTQNPFSVMASSQFQGREDNKKVDFCINSCCHAEMLISVKTSTVISASTWCYLWNLWRTTSTDVFKIKRQSIPSTVSDKKGYISFLLPLIQQHWL